MDAVASCARSACGRMMLQRTAKSCGPDAGVKLAERSVDDGGKQARSPGSTKETVKTIARGMPGVFRCDRGDKRACFLHYYTRGCGRIGRPSFPAPSV